MCEKHLGTRYRFRGFGLSVSRSVLSQRVRPGRSSRQDDGGLSVQELKAAERYQAEGLRNDVAGA